MADNTSETNPRSLALRAELKEWERAFAAANGGRKAERDDIKKNPEIAAKYKEYSKLKQPPKPAELQRRPKKRKHSSTDIDANTENIPPISTPRKAARRADPFVTPSKKQTSSFNLDYVSPGTFPRLFSPSMHRTPPLKSAIGPTPQRDGKALGLFDLLSASGGSTATPTAERLASVRGAAAVTPSKRRAMDTIAEEDEENNVEEESPRMARTPQSSGKKYMLSTLFATPTTWRYAMMENETDRAGTQDDAAATATAAAAEVEDTVNQPTESETPSFLRRSNTARYAAASRTQGGLSPTAVRKPPQFVGKGLSALVQGLRDMEEERMQDEWDILREIEIEAEQTAAGDVDVPDSQAPETEGARHFKKKGQKRTTRRVNMKPVISKPRPEPQLPASDDEGDKAAQESDDELAAVPETQHPNIPAADTQEWDDDTSLHSLTEPDFDSDDDYEESSRPLGRSKSFTEKMKEAIGADKSSKPAPETKPASRPAEKDTEKKPSRPRKVNPEAHANYRSLKIRNKNSKGRFGRRFGRR